MNDDRIDHGCSTGGVLSEPETFAPMQSRDHVAALACASSENAREMQRLTALTEILRGWIWETDTEHRFTYLSESVTKYVGRSPEWHYGKTRQELGNLHPDNADHQHYLRQLDAREKFGPIDFVRYQNGLQLWMRTIGLPQFDAEGRFTGYFGLAFEVTAEIESRQGNRRGEPRRKVARTATIMDQGSPSPVPCVILDVSGSGARLDVHASATVPQRFKLLIDVDGSERLCEVVWRRQNAVGVRFCDTAWPS